MGNVAEVGKGTKIKCFIALIFITMVCGYIYCLAAYVSPLSEARGWAPEQIVLAYSVAMITVSPAFVIAGIVSQKFGIKKIMLIGGLTYGACIFLSGLVTSVLLFIILQGVVCAMAMYMTFLCSISVINMVFPNKKGTMVGLLYGINTAGVAVISPVVTALAAHFSIGAALMLQGGGIMIIMLIGVLLIQIPGNVDQANEDEEDVAAADNGADMNWKQMIKHPSFYLLFITIVFVMMIGNVLASDAAYIAENNLGTDSVKSAFIVSVFNIGACVGGIIIGIIADKIGPFKTTAYTAVFNAVVLVIVALAGLSSYTVFAAAVAVMGLTYNGMSALNAVMITEGYGARNLGVNMGILGISIMIAGIIGPQLGLALPAAMVFIVCAVLSILGAVSVLGAVKSLNRHYGKTIVK